MTSLMLLSKNPAFLLKWRERREDKWVLGMEAVRWTARASLHIISNNIRQFPTDISTLSHTHTHRNLLLSVTHTLIFISYLNFLLSLPSFLTFLSFLYQYNLLRDTAKPLWSVHCLYPFQVSGWKKCPHIPSHPSLICQKP